MTNLQLLLLYSVRFSAEPIAWVATDDEEEQGVWFGFTFPYEDKEEIVVALGDLCQRNLILLAVHKNWRPRDWQLDNVPVPIENPTAEIIRGGFNDRSIYYRLTSEGGAVWEELFKVDWNKYIKISNSLDDEVDTLNAKIATSVYENLETVIQREFSGTYDEIEPENRTVEELSPWDVTYWKTLTTGFRATCKFRKKPPSEIRYSEQSRAWLFEWYDASIIDFRHNA